MSTTNGIDALALATALSFLRNGDLDGAAAKAAELRGHDDIAFAFIDAQVRLLRQPFEMWLKVSPSAAPTRPIEGLQLELVQMCVQNVVEALLPLERALRASLGERCPLPTASALSALSATGVDDDGAVPDGDVLTHWLEARRLWMALCIYVAAAGGTTMTAPRSVSAPSVDLGLVQRTLEARKELTLLLEKHGAWGEGLEDDVVTFLKNSRFGGPSGVSLFELPPSLASVWLSEMDSALSALSVMLGDGDEVDA